MVKFPRTDTTDEQDLSAAALNMVTSFTKQFRLDQVIVHASVAITETITITVDTKKGADYDTVLAEVALIAETDFVFRPQGESIFVKGDQIRVQITDGNSTGEVFVTIKTSELGG